MTLCSPDNVRFVDISDGDVEETIGLWQSTGLTRPWNDPRKDIAFARASDNATVLVGRAADDRLVSAVMVGHDGHRGAIYYLATDPTCQRRGLGRAAMAAAEHWLAARGVWKVNLMIRTENALVRRFYEALGYDDQQCVVFGRYLDGRTFRESPPD